MVKGSILSQQIANKFLNPLMIELHLGSVALDQYSGYNIYR